MSLIYFILASYGLTQILVYAKIFDSLRPAHYFFHCSMCMGFHVGLFLWAINKYTELFTFDYSITTAFVLSCVSSGTAYVLSVVFGDEGINFEKRGDGEC